MATRAIGQTTVQRPVESRRRSFGPLVLLPGPLGWMTFFYLVPLGILLVHAFWSVSYPNIDHTPTLTNVRTFFSSELYGRVFLRTVGMALAVTVTDLAIAYPLAFFLAKRVRRYRELMLVLVIFPLWSSYLVRVFAWKSLLGTSGILNSFLIWSGVIDEPVSFLLYSKWAMYIAFCHVWLPFMILPLYTILERIPNNLLEAAADLGSSGLRTFWRVILPLARPGMLAGGLSVFSLTMGDYITPTLLGGPGDQMIGRIIADQFGVANNQPLGAMLVIPVLLTISTVLAISNRSGAMERTAA
ncbi:MAG: spermidine/putrescine transport system permease protein [Thermomicrobiales bacterium]|nr:spermidine/putrescine transport system permease protein [Thermomicrobiales bacterium]